MKIYLYELIFLVAWICALYLFEQCNTEWIQNNSISFLNYILAYEHIFFATMPFKVFSQLSMKQKTVNLLKLFYYET